MYSVTKCYAAYRC